MLLIMILAMSSIGLIHGILLLRGNGMYGFVNPLDSTLDTNNKKNIYIIRLYIFI